MNTLFLALILAQPAQAPPVKEPLQAPPIEYTVWDAANEAREKRLPLVVFAGVPAQDLSDLDVVTFTGPATIDPNGARPSIMYKFWDSPQWYRVPPEAAIRFYLPGKAVPQRAVPFLFLTAGVFVCNLPYSAIHSLETLVLLTGFPYSLRL